jgi:ABC-type branched-subunit amino acid transport system substrate-binding protein
MTDPTRKPAWLQLTAIFSAGVLVGAMSAVQIAPSFTTSQLVTSPGPIPTGPAAAAPGPGGENDPQGGVAPPNPSIDPTAIGPPVPAGVECAAGKNGGATDVGVTADRIKLATTTVQSGRGASFLGEVKFAMEAVKNKVNREGGICGRLLDIRYVDDGWDPARGVNAIRSFINEGVFAIPVGPSSEGMQLAIKSGDIDGAGIPVVGADGMVINQYGSPWVWPVAVATVSAARIMVRNAHARGARNFGIVFDKDYKFGQEAAAAYNNEVRRLTGSDVPGFNAQNSCRRSFCGVEQGASSYATEVNQFEPGDFVAMFLEPGTALTWMYTAGSPKPETVTYGIGAAQPMFTREFATQCQRACHGMWIWTGYRPPIAPYDGQPAVRTYVSDLLKTKPNADKENAFSEGGYVGMLLLVDALRETGPFLTRAGLAATLDRMTSRSGLAIQDDLRWRPGDHFANTTMQAFEIQFRSLFAGWVAKDIMQDRTPELGVS